MIFFEARRGPLFCHEGAALDTWTRQEVGATMLVVEEPCLLDG